jgi:hypothetical protein
MGSPPGTTRPASTTRTHVLPPPVREHQAKIRETQARVLGPEWLQTIEDENYLAWAEEALRGPYEPCSRCGGSGMRQTQIGDYVSCHQCDSAGRTLRIHYLLAERKLSPAQRAQIGQEGLIEQDEASAGAFQVDE